MAFFDTTLLLSNSQAITTTAASTTIYDVTGAGSGNAPAMVFGTNTTTYGVDIGTGDGVATPYAYWTVITAGTGAGTVSFAVEAAPNSSNSPGTYITLATSKAYTGTALTAGLVIAIPVPPFAPIANAETLPRFYRFNYVVSGSATVTVSGYIGINPPLGFVSTQYAANFTSV